MKHIVALLLALIISAGSLTAASVSSEKPQFQHRQREQRHQQQRQTYQRQSTQRQSTQRQSYQWKSNQSKSYQGKSNDDDLFSAHPKDRYADDNQKSKDQESKDKQKSKDSKNKKKQDDTSQSGSNNIRVADASKRPQTKEEKLAANKKLTRDPDIPVTFLEDFKGNKIERETYFEVSSAKDTYCQGPDSMWYPVLRGKNAIRWAGYSEKYNAALKEWEKRQRGNARTYKQPDEIIAWDFPPIEKIDNWFDDYQYSIRRNGYWGLKCVNGDGDRYPKEWLKDRVSCTYNGPMTKFCEGVLMRDGKNDDLWGLWYNGKMILPAKYRATTPPKDLGTIKGLIRFTNNEETYVVDLRYKREGQERPFMTPALKGGYNIRFFSEGYQSHNVNETDVYFIAEKDGKATIYNRKCQPKSTFDCKDISKLKFVASDQAFYDENGNGYDVDPTKSRRQRSATLKIEKFAQNIWYDGEKCVRFDVEVKVTNLLYKNVYVEAVLCNAQGRPFVNNQRRSFRFNRHTYVTRLEDTIYETFFVPNYGMNLLKGKAKKFIMKYRVYYKEKDSDQQIDLCSGSQPLEIFLTR